MTAQPVSTQSHSTSLGTTVHVNGKRPWRVVVIESQTLFRELLAKIIGADKRFALLGAVEGGGEGKNICEQFHPDLVLMEVRQSQTDGVELAAVIIKNCPLTRVLVISELKDAITFNRLVSAGVHGFVGKDQPWEILEEAMDEVAAGRSYFTAELCQSQERLKSDPTGFAKLLNVREQAILSYVAAGWTSRSIADRLELSHRSVETYRYRMMRKLGLANLAGLIDYAHRNGFITNGSVSRATA